MQPVININLRKDKEKDGKHPIVLQVYYKGKRKQVFTGLYVKDVDFKNGKVINIPNKAHYNQLIVNKKNELEREFINQAVTGLIALNSKKVVKEHSFFPYAYQMLEQMKTRCKKSYLDRFGYLLEQFRAWSGDVMLSDITPDYLKAYEKYLFDKGITPNTIGRNLKKIKQVLNDYGTPIKFKTITYRQPKREFLTVHEIEQIEQSDYDHIVKWYFLLSCYTGLRYGDMQGIKNKVVLNDGIYRMILSTTKTGEVVSIKLIDKVIGILENINEPIPTNEQSNRVLKEMAAVCGIDKRLTFHIARHSFAVNSANLGFPIEVVSKLLGHSSIRTTAIYFKITDTRIDEFMDRWG